MTVDAISKNKIRIDLSNEEIDIFFGGYENINYNDPDSKLALHLLLNDALPDELLPLDCKQVMIEVRPTNSGCSILFTKLSHNTRKKYKLTGCIKSYIITFTDSESMIYGCRELAQTIPKSVRSELLFDNDGYYLILHSTVNISKQLLHIKEYCLCVVSQLEILSKISEYAIPICDNNALEKIARAF